MTKKMFSDPAEKMVLQIMEQSSKDLAYTTNKLIDNLTYDRDQLQATLSAVRDEIDALLRGPFMPTPDRLLKALWPSDQLIAKHLAAKEY